MTKYFDARDAVQCAVKRRELVGLRRGRTTSTVHRDTRVCCIRRRLFVSEITPTRSEGSNTHTLEAIVSPVELRVKRGIR